MTNGLVDPTDLNDFPGAPFADTVVDAAVDALTNFLGWHVAPSVTETVSLDARGGRYLFLPSLKVEAIVEVRDVTGSSPVIITDWFRAGEATLARESGWPCRERAVEVDLTHGFDTCPAALLQVVAEMCQDAQRTSGLAAVHIDDYSESYAPGASTVGSVPPSAAATYYRVPRRSR